MVSSQGGGSWNADEYWHGNFMYLPGTGSEEILIRDAANANAPSAGDTTATPWPLTTRSMWTLKCLPSLARGSGEGFVAVTPDGTQYRFDWLVSRPYATVSKPDPGPVFLAAGSAGSKTKTTATTTSKIGGGGITPNVVSGYVLTRQEVWILPTTVTDRFGNTVSYTYDTAKPWRLLSIAGSDGRSITLSYGDALSDHVTSVSDGSYSWSYGYSNGLSSLTQPDGSSWQFSMAALTAGQPLYTGSPDCLDEGGLNTIADTGSMTHPSGAVGSFTVQPTSHSRSFVENVCRGSLIDGTSFAMYPRYISSKSIVNKTITGPGLPSMAWNYLYSAAAGTGSWLGCSGICPESKTVEVRDPDNTFTRYTFGNRFRVTEGQLQQIEVGPVGGAALRTTSLHYRAPDAGPYPSYIGASAQRRGDADLARRYTPMDLRVISQQGSAFSWTAISTSSPPFDSKARPLIVSRFGPGASRTETTVYRDFTDPWVLGQIGSVTESGGNSMLSNTFDAATTNLQSTARFGKLEQSFSYWADGTLKTRADGLGQTTSFSNYLRGLARNVSYANGASESAAVNNQGCITSVTDANGYTTGYGCDAMGRLNLITPPAGWNSTTLVFEPVAGAEVDLPAGHWRQTIATGNARTVSYFDGLWRERLRASSDNADLANTSSMVLHNYDAAGHSVFESYPARSIASVNAAPAGVAYQYDALGRTTRSDASSELGALSAYTYYDAGFVTRQVNARGFTTSTGYTAWDNPEDAAISSITAPENVSLAISRDVFGKPLSVTRGGNGLSLTRSYVYEPLGQLLCKTVEPETGATVQAYDAANNLAWRAAGLSLIGTGSCDSASVGAASKTSYGYDNRNRLISTTYGDAGVAIGRSYTADGLLAGISSNNANWTYGYNTLRLLASETLLYNSQTYASTRNYNANGHLTQLVYPSAGPTLSYTPNALGQPTQVGSYASAVHHHPNGAVASYTLANGIAHNLTQNTRGLPASNSDAGVLQDVYSYDANANVTGIADQIYGKSRGLGYDGLDRMTVANAPNLWGSGTYAYNTLDNITASSVGSRNSTHGYDAANRLQSINSNGSYTGFSYDSQGNTTARGAQGYYFDQANRLLLVTGIASYSYDGLGRRLYSVGSNGSNKTTVYSQGGQLLYASVQQGMSSSSTSYIYLAGKLIAQDGTAGIVFNHTDALGSPVARSNSAGALISNSWYEAYGKTAGGTEPAVIGFTGHVNDIDSGLIYMQQRYYDPISARFLSADPVAADPNSGSSFNRYVYGNNNPYRYIDPDGREFCGAYQCDIYGSGNGGAGASTREHLESFRPYAETMGKVTEKLLDIYMEGVLFLAGSELFGGGKAVLMVGRAMEAAAVVESVAAKGATRALSVEGRALLTSNPIGSALKADPTHRAATFMREEAAAKGTNFAIAGGDGVTRTLTQVPGRFNGVAGRYEYIVDNLNNLTHQMFVRGGSINGIPIKP